MLFPLYGRREGVRLALGLHPMEVSRVDLDRELRLFAGYAGHTSYIGEIGVDLSEEGRPSQRTQEEVFTAILTEPGVAEKVLTVHSRGASRQTIGHLVDAGAKRAILHWFSGSHRDLDDALAAGFYFSVNPAMVGAARSKALVDAIPPDRVLLESDGPYARIRGRVVEPADVLGVVSSLARLWDRGESDVIAQLDSNLMAMCTGLPEIAVPGD
jgi:TatD DNase family protein